MTRCTSIVTIIGAECRGLGTVQCNYHDGHDASGGNAFAFHTGYHKGRTIAWRAGEACVFTSQDARAAWEEAEAAKVGEALHGRAG